MEILDYSVEFVKDPFGILAGRRYEFVMNLEVPEDDELYSENGLYIRVVYSVNDGPGTVVKYDLYERTTDRYLEFDLDEEEEQAIAVFCEEHYAEAEV